MSRPARYREVLQLRERYRLPGQDLKPGAPAQILAAGGWPYEAIVTKVMEKRAWIEYLQRRGGHRERVVPFTDIFVPAALQKLRAGLPAVASELCGCGLASEHEGPHASHEDGTPL